MSTPEPVYFLLVDDLEENLLALEALLRRDGLVMLTARSGSEALEHLLQHDVALALIDVQMPVMDGFELAELMRGTDRTRRTPIIFVTAGSGDPQRRFRGYEAGAVDFLRKPIETDILRSKADVFYELYRQRQEVTRQRDELRVAGEENARLLEISRQHAEALQRADRLKDEFLATLAHELRNPLAPIRSAVEIMRASQLSDANLVRARDVIDRQVRNLARLVDDLLDVSRIATGKLVLRLATTDLRSLVDQAVEMVRPLIDTRSHQLELQLPEAAVRLHADAVRLTQVLANLLSNAAKYTDVGGRIALEAHIMGDQIEVRVKDSGVGIPSEMLGAVFGLFTQVDSSGEQTKEGLGVGLALVRKLVEMHGGTVTAESAGTGRGSTFIVRLPLTTSDHGSQAVAEPPKAKPAAPAKRRVMVVDDNIDGASSLAMLVQIMGHSVRTAHTGPDAVTLAQEFRPDVIFLDIGLPGMNGYEVTQTLRRDPEFAATKIIALTGWGNDEDRRRAVEAGFNHHMTKPAEAKEVARIVSQSGSI